jgi:hypothetical protein
MRKRRRRIPHINSGAEESALSARQETADYVYWNGETCAALDA